MGASAVTGSSKDWPRKVCAAKGYLSKALLERLWKRGLLFLTGIGRTMKNHLMPLLDKDAVVQTLHH